MNKKTIFIVLGIVILAGLVTVGIVLKKPTPAPVEAPTAPSEEAAEGPTETPAETPTGTPAETSSAETPGLSSCVMLDEGYCDKGELLPYQDKPMWIGFNVPKGTKIYSPADGLYGTEVLSFNGTEFDVMVPPFENGLDFWFIGAAPIWDKRGKEVKKGELIGTAIGELLDISTDNKKYTLLIAVRRANWHNFAKLGMEGTSFDLSAAREYFPNISQ